MGSLIPIRPTSDVSQTGVSWANSPNGGSWWNNVNEVVPDDGSYNGAGADGSFTVRHGPIPVAVAIFKLEVYLRYQFSGSYTAQRARVGLIIGGTPYWASDFAANSATYTTVLAGTWPNNPAGGPWTKSALDASYFVVEYYSSLSESIGFSWLQGLVDMVAAPRNLGSERYVASSALRLRRRRILAPVVDAPLRAILDNELLDDVKLSHPEIPGLTGFAGEAWWKRFQGAIMASSLDLNAMRGRLQALDTQELYTLLWRPWRTQDSPSAERQGQAAGDAGAGEAFTRSSPDWILDPAVAAQGGRRVVKLFDDQVSDAADGLSLMPTRTNYVLRSSAVSSMTGVTTSGAGTTVANNGEQLFDPAVAGQSWLMTAGNPNSSDTVLQVDTATILANHVVVAWVDHRDVSGVAIALRVQRLLDNWYWNDATSAWQSGAVDLTLQVRSSSGIDGTKTFSVGTTNTALRITVRQPSGGAASRQNRVFHIQVEESSPPTFSHIVTDGAAVTRQAALQTIVNDHGRWIWWRDHGSLRIRLKVPWGTPDLTDSTDRVIFDLTWDANNYERLMYQKSSLSWVYRRRLGGVNYDAILAATITRGDEVRIQIRWASERGELGLAPYTTSIIVNGVRGTDGAPTGVPSSIPSSTLLCIGHRPGPADGGAVFVSQLDISPLVLADDILKDLG